MGLGGDAVSMFAENLGRMLKFFLARFSLELLSLALVCDLFSLVSSLRRSTPVFSFGSSRRGFLLFRFRFLGLLSLSVRS